VEVQFLPSHSNYQPPIAPPIPDPLLLQGEEANRSLEFYRMTTALRRVGYNFEYALSDHKISQDRVRCFVDKINQLALFTPETISEFRRDEWPILVLKAYKIGLITLDQLSTTMIFHSIGETFVWGDRQRFIWRDGDKFNHSYKSTDSSFPTEIIFFKFLQVASQGKDEAKSPYHRFKARLLQANLPNSEKHFLRINVLLGDLLAKSALLSRIEDIRISVLGFDELGLKEEYSSEFQSKKHKQLILPSMAIYRIFLETISDHPVVIRPWFGKVTAKDIQMLAVNHERPVQFYFKGFPLPREADGFRGLTPFEFIEHDLYHCFRATTMEKKYQPIIAQLSALLKTKYSNDFPETNSVVFSKIIPVMKSYLKRIICLARIRKQGKKKLGIKIADENISILSKKSYSGDIYLASDILYVYIDPKLFVMLQFIFISIYGSKKQEIYSVSSIKKLIEMLDTIESVAFQRRDLGWNLADGELKQTNRQFNKLVRSVYDQRHDRADPSVGPIYLGDMLHNKVSKIIFHSNVSEIEKIKYRLLFFEVLILLSQYETQFIESIPGYDPKRDLGGLKPNYEYIKEFYT